MRARAGYGQGIGNVIGLLGALLVIPIYAAIKSLWEIAWPIALIFIAFLIFMGGCLVLMGLAKLIILWTERYEKRHPEAFKAMRDAEVARRLEQFKVEQQQNVRT
jgi:hypothetical protein